MINTTATNRGRFGNQFIISMGFNFIAKNNNIKVTYKDYDRITELGIDLFIGTNTYDDTIKLTDENFFEYITEKMEIPSNISIANDAWFQTRKFSFYLKEYFNDEKIRNNVIENNIYKERIGNNNDVFVHVRLGDIADKFPNSYTYYDNALSTIKFENGFISSDSIDNLMCKKLIEKFNLNIINKNEVQTIMFGSTCKNVVTSQGTFSWLIAFLAFNSNIYYPKNMMRWHGDIFVFPEWNGISQN